MENTTNNLPIVLIADDEPEIRNVVERFLSRRGYESVTAENGDEALGKSKVQKPDIILLDLTMPGLDGLTVCKKLREDPSTRLTPILILTARGSDHIGCNVCQINAGDEDHDSQQHIAAESDETANQRGNG